MNNFTLLLKKCVYPYEFINDWEKFNKTSLPEKEEFYSKLNMKDSDSDQDYNHEKAICKDFEIKKFERIS